MGHRGARSLFPENTLEGLRAAMQAGVAHLEVDVALTADGVVVLSHDQRTNPVLTRGPDGRWLRGRTPPIATQRFSDLQRLDVGRLRPGSGYARGFARQCAIDGARIPSLAAALQLGPCLRWTIEVKTSPSLPRLTVAPAVMAACVMAVVDAAGAASRVTIQSFDWRVQAAMQRTRPDVRLAWLTARATRAWRGGQAALPGSVAAVSGPGGTWSPRYRELTRRRLIAAHGAGLRVVPWTVNERSVALRLAEWGVDGMITDDPVAMTAWLAG